MRPLIYLTVLSGNFLYRPRRARVVPREFLLRDKALMLDVGNLRRRVETRESFITDETNLMEKKEEGGRKKERKKEGKKDEREKGKGREIYTHSHEHSAWNRVSFLFRRRVREFLAPRDYERSHFA